MRETRIIMGMPVTVEIAGAGAEREALEEVFIHFCAVDERFSTYKPTSEISRINAGAIKSAEASQAMKTVFILAEQTRRETNGYFDIRRADGSIDPSGLVKGWAIQNAAGLLRRRGVADFFIDAGGDIEVNGRNASGQPWRIGIRDPFDPDYARIVKVLSLDRGGVATSGTSVRGRHIYNPHQRNIPIDAIISLTVIGPNVYEADRFATAAFAMGRAGIAFIAARDGLEGYMIDTGGIATMTDGFSQYVIQESAHAC